MVTNLVLTSPNESIFLYLKKSFCLVECMRLNRIIKLNDEVVELTDLENELKEKLAILRDDFIYPFDAMRYDCSIVDFEELAHRVKSVMHPDPLLDTENNPPKMLCDKITNNDIYIGVNKHKAFDKFKERFLEKNGYWTDIGHSVVSLMNWVKEIFNALEAYLSFSKESSSMGLVKAIHYLNLLEYIEWVFYLNQYNETVFTS